MLVREIKQNESVKFRVPCKIAEQIRLIKSECKKLKWQFVLNDEIAQLIEKQCRKAYAEIQAELDRRKQETCEEVDVEARSVQVRSQKNKTTPPNTKPLPIMMPTESE